MAASGARPRRTSQCPIPAPPVARGTLPHPPTVTDSDSSLSHGSDPGPLVIGPRRADIMMRRHPAAAGGIRSLTEAQ
eukprot:768320-Hanusia_phi.AAC.17